VAGNPLEIPDLTKLMSRLLNSGHGQVGVRTSDRILVPDGASPFTARPLSYCQASFALGWGRRDAVDCCSEQEKLMAASDWREELAEMLAEKGYSQPDIEKIIQQIGRRESETQVDSIMDSIDSGSFDLAAIIAEALKEDNR
jgi:hypothetical protein